MLETLEIHTQLHNMATRVGPLVMRQEVHTMYGGQMKLTVLERLAEMEEYLTICVGGHCGLMRPEPDSQWLFEMQEEANEEIRQLN